MTRILLLTVLGLLGVGSLAAADGEYSYSNGYYWKGNDAYTRGYYTSPGYYGQGYYYCGRYYSGAYYPGTSYYTYSYAYTKQAAAKVPAYTPNWKSELIQYAKSRDDQQAYLSALKAMGLNGQTYEFQQASYAKSYAYPAQGDTIYGYTYSQLQHAYGETNMNTLYQQSARLTQGAQSLAGQANSEFAGLVQQAGDNQLRLAEYFAKAQAIAIAAKAVEPQPQSVTQTTVQGGGVVTGKANGGSQVEQTTASGSTSAGTATGTAAAGEGNGGDFMAKVARPLCASCHSTKDPAGKFDIETYPSLTAEQKASVWERLTTTDASKRMPRNVKDRTKPGEPLTAAQLAEFFKN